MDYDAWNLERNGEWMEKPVTLGSVKGEKSNKRQQKRGEGRILERIR